MKSSVKNTAFSFEMWENGNSKESDSMTKGFTTDFYKQFEEISKKLGELLSENKELKKIRKMKWKN